MTLFEKMVPESRELIQDDDILSVHVSKNSSDVWITEVLLTNDSFLKILEQAFEEGSRVNIHVGTFDGNEDKSLHVSVEDPELQLILKSVYSYNRVLGVIRQHRSVVDEPYVSIFESGSKYLRLLLKQSVQKGWLQDEYL